VSRILPVRVSILILLALVAAPSLAADPEWLWANGDPKENDTVFFRKTFELKGKPKAAVFSGSCDNVFTLFVNGQMVTQGSEWSLPVREKLEKHLVEGKNVIAVRGANQGSAAAFIAILDLENADGSKQQIVTEALNVYSQRVVAFIDAAMSGARTPEAKVEALFKAFAKRVEQGDFLHSCPAATVCLDLDAGLEPLRVVVADALDDYLNVIEKHFPMPDRRRGRSFAGLLLTAIEGGYIRSRAERSGKPFREAGAWLAELAARESP